MNDDIESFAPSRPACKSRARVFTPEEEQIIRDYIHYDPLTGNFTWKRDVGAGGQCKAGTTAGSISVDKYGHKRWRIFIKGIKVQAHRLAFFLMMDRWPAYDTDHIDGNALNNKFSNLREATRTENSRNRKTSRLSGTGYKGVCRLPYPGIIKRFRAMIKFEGKQWFLGVYHTEEEASDAYLSASLFAFGEFTRLD